MDLFSFNSNQFIEEYCNNFRYNFIDIESRLYDWTTYLLTVVTVHTDVHAMQGIYLWLGLFLGY